MKALHVLFLLVLSPGPAFADGVGVDTLLPAGVPEGLGVGAAIDIDGTRALVGAASAGRMGAAYVLQRAGTDWNISASLQLGDGVGSGQGYGNAVALQGDAALVGAPRAEFSTLLGATGRVQFFLDTGGAWYSPSSLFSAGLGAGDRYGASLAMTTIGGNEFAAVGAPGHGAGTVFVYRRFGNSWVEVAKLTLATAVPGDDFGASVDFDGAHLVVGAPGTSFIGGFAHGRVAFFRNNDGLGSNWSFLGSATDPQLQSNASFGTSVALRGNRAAIGSPF